MSAAKLGPTPKLIPSGSELIELNPSSAKYLRQIGHVPCYIQIKNINNNTHHIYYILNGKSDPLLNTHTQMLGNHN